MLSPAAAAGLWSGLLQWSKVGVNALVFIVLSRWLSLAEIGAVAAAQAPFLFTNTLQSAIFPDLIVQERESERGHLSSLFHLSVGCAAPVVLVVWAAILFAPGLGLEEATGRYLAVLSVLPLISGVGCIYEGILRRGLRLRQLALRTTAASAAAGLIAVALAVSGHGGWAIVAFTLVNAVLSVGLSIAWAGWLPQPTLDLAYLKSRSSILTALLGRHALSAAVIPLLQISVSAQLGAAAGGVFQIAFRIFTLADSVVVTPFRFLILPTFARAARRQADLTGRMVAAADLGAVIFFPAYFGLLATASTVIPLLIGPTNGGAVVSAVQILAVYGPLSLLTWITNHAVTAVGGAVLVFRRSLLMYALVVAPCLVAAFVSLQMLLLIYAVWGGGVGMAFALAMAKARFGLSATVFLRPLLAPLAASLAMVAGLSALHPFLLGLAPGPTAALLVAAGIALYLAGMGLVGREQLLTLARLLRSRAAVGSVALADAGGLGEP